VQVCWLLGDQFKTWQLAIDTMATMKPACCKCQSFRTSRCSHVMCGTDILAVMSLWTVMDPQEPGGGHGKSSPTSTGVHCCGSGASYTTRDGSSLK
jgi:hypothetical protein